MRTLLLLLWLDAFLWGGGAAVAFYVIVHRGLLPLFLPGLIVLILGPLMVGAAVLATFRREGLRQAVCGDYTVVCGLAVAALLGALLMLVFA